MIFHPVAHGLTNDFKLGLIESYLKQLIELNYVAVTPATKELLLWLVPFFKSTGESISSELEKKIFTSLHPTTMTTAKACVGKQNALVDKVEITQPLRGLTVAGDFIDSFNIAVYCTIAAIIAALYPMHYRLDRDDIEQFTVESEAEELLSLLRLQAHMTVDNLKSVAKAVYYHYQILPELGSNQGVVRDRLCDALMSLDDASDVVEDAAVRYDNRPR